MRKMFRALVAIALFVVFSGVLMIYVAPFFTTKNLGEPPSHSVESRIPVLVVVQEGGHPIFVATQMRDLDKVTGKYPGHSFLLPSGSKRIVDQDGDAASYTATEIKPGRQLIQLAATVGDYPYNVEYEAEEKKIFPLRASYKDEKQGAIFTIPISLLLTWLAMRVTRRRTAASVHAHAASHDDGQAK